MKANCWSQRGQANTLEHCSLHHQWAEKHWAWQKNLCASNHEVYPDLPEIKRLEKEKVCSSGLRTSAATIVSHWLSNSIYMLCFLVVEFSSEGVHPCKVIRQNPIWNLWCAKAHMSAHEKVFYSNSDDIDLLLEPARRPQQAGSPQPHQYYISRNAMVTHRYCTEQ